MEAPIGYIRLRDAADIVGRKLYGPAWRALDELKMDGPIQKKMDDGTDDGTWRIIAVSIIGGGLDAKVERVIRLIAEKCEAGKIETLAGVDPLSHKEWRAPHWRNYFVFGTINVNRPGAEICEREIYVRHEDVDRLVKELNPASQKSRAGAPAKHDRDALEQLFWELWHSKGDFNELDQADDWKSKAAAARTLLALVTRPGVEPPDQKTVEKYIKGWLQKGKPAGT
jgi:hypothetical protein